jgi:hypothetical protein
MGRPFVASQRRAFPVYGSLVKTRIPSGLKAAAGLLPLPSWSVRQLLPSEHALVAAGARNMLIIFPDERLLQRWDLATLRRDGGTRQSPIRGWIRRLLVGSDSDGPALAYWQEGSVGSGGGLLRFSFIDLDSLAVLKVGSILAGRHQGGVSPSGGSFTSDWTLGERLRIRASAVGTLFAMWETGVSGESMFAFSVHGDAIVAAQPSGNLGQLVPGPDGPTVFTGSGSRIDASGKPIGRAETPGPSDPRFMVIPTPEPALYLSIGGLPGVAFDANGALNWPPGAVSVSVHSASDGSSLLTVHSLDEMATSTKLEDWYHDDFTAEKRFHFVPAAHVLVTIPPSNDRLVLRRLDVDQARDSVGRDQLAVVSLPTLTATVGRQIVHRIEARSKKGPISFTLARGPDGLEVDRDGKMTWTVPPAQKGQDVTAVIVIGDASGQQLFHILRIHVD